MGSQKKMLPEFIIVGWSLLDVIATTVTSSRTGAVTNTTATPLSNGTSMTTLTTIDGAVTSTTMDLCLLGWVRAVVMIAWVVTLSRCSRRTGVTEEAVFHVSLVIKVLIGMYGGTKVLLFAEHEQVLSDRGRQTLIGWTCCACLVNICLLFWSRRIYVTSSVTKWHCASSEETTALLDGKESTEKHENTDWSVLVYRLFKVSIPDLPYITCGICFLLGDVTCEVLVPQFTGKVVDSLVVNPSERGFWNAISRLVAVAAGLTFCSWVQKLCFGMYVARVTERLRQVLFACLMSQDVDFFDEYETGDLVTSLMTDIAFMGLSLSPNLDQCLKGIFGVVGVMMCMAKTSWQLSVLSAISIPAFVATSYGYGMVMKGVGINGQTIMGEMGEQADENLSNIRTVRSFAMEPAEVKIFHDSAKRLSGVGRREAFAHSTFQPLATLIQISLQVSALFYGGHLVQRGVLSGGDLVTFVIFLSMVNACVQIINATYGGVAKGIGCSHIVFKHLYRKAKHTGKGTLVKNNFRGEIEFKDVCFSYPIRPNHTVLHNLSFRVSPGEVVALVGPSGGGKSTCLSLLLNFYQPHSGHVLLDGVPVNQYDHSCLHSKMALVGQEPVLFSRSIRDNITYGFLGPRSEDDVISTAMLANAHDFIRALPGAYDTNAGAKGLQISGGQKQRVAIARALIRQPVVLLLDEATSALDSHSEAKVQEALDGSMKGRTVIIVAHRLSTVQKADRVLVIHKGRVMEEGTPSDLMKTGGLFASLAQHQLKRADSSSEFAGRLEELGDDGDSTDLADNDVHDGMMDDDYIGNMLSTPTL